MKIIAFRKKAKRVPEAYVLDLRTVLDEFAVHSPEALREMRERSSSEGGKRESGVQMA